MGRVMFRVWVVLSLVWLAFVYASRAAWSFPVFNVAILPPVFLGLVFMALVWIGGGFSRDA